jgi:hypothetical protein
MVVSAKREILYTSCKMSKKAGMILTFGMLQLSESPE